MPSWCSRHAHALTLAFVATFAADCLAQTSETFTGDWKCDTKYVGYNYQFGLHIERNGPNRWNAMSKLLTTNDPVAKSNDVHLKGSIALDSSGAPMLSADVSIHNLRWRLNSHIDLPTGSKMELTFTETSEDGETSTLWVEDCKKEASSRVVALREDVVSQPKMQDTRPNKPDDKSQPQQSESNSAQSIKQQIEQGEITSCDCGKMIIVTVVGYFEYDHEIDLTTGAKNLQLKFQPYPLAGNYHSKNAQLSLQPRLKIADESIALQGDELPQNLDPTTPRMWNWSIHQPWLSNVSETDGIIRLNLKPAVGDPVFVDLPKMKVKGRPWWWLIPWFWENVLGKPEVSFGLLVIVVIAWRQGIKAAWVYAWARINEIAGGGKKHRTN